MSDRKMEAVFALGLSAQICVHTRGSHMENLSEIKWIDV